MQGFGMVGTLKIYEILEEAKVDDCTARAITRAIEKALEENNIEQAKVLASKADIACLKEDIARLEIKISDTKAEIIRWMFIFWLGQIPIMAMLIKLIR